MMSTLPPNGAYIAQVQFEQHGELPTYVYVLYDKVLTVDGAELLPSACRDFKPARANSKHVKNQIEIELVQLKHTNAKLRDVINKLLGVITGSAAQNAIQAAKDIL